MIDCSHSWVTFAKPQSHFFPPIENHKKCLTNQQKIRGFGQEMTTLEQLQANEEVFLEKQKGYQVLYDYSD